MTRAGSGRAISCTTSKGSPSRTRASSRSTRLWIRERIPSTDAGVNELFTNAWEKHKWWDFLKVLQYSLLYVCAYHENKLVGYVNVAWDGAQHAFILDTTVHKDFQRRGIGIQIVKHAAEAAKKYNLDWLHVDFDPYLKEFYRKCCFRYTDAGLINLRDRDT